MERYIIAVAYRWVGQTVQFLLPANGDATPLTGSVEGASTRREAAARTILENSISVKPSGPAVHVNGAAIWAVAFLLTKQEEQLARQRTQDAGHDFRWISASEIPDNVLGIALLEIAAELP